MKIHYYVYMSDMHIGFAEGVREAITRVPQSGRFGSRKVFIFFIWNALVHAGCTALTLDDFKRQLIAAQRAGEVSLARADLVAAMPRDAVAASEIVHNGTTWHFALDPSAHDAWMAA